MESLTGRIGANTRAKPQLPSDKTPNSSVEQVTVVEPRFRTSNALAARRPSKNRSARWKSRLGLKRLSISPRGSPDRKVFDKPLAPSALASETLRVHETAAATSSKYSVLTPFCLDCRIAVTLSQAKHVGVNVEITRHPRNPRQCFPAWS